MYNRRPVLIGVVQEKTMLVKVLKGKLHRATVTETKLHYPGSIAMDEKS